MVATSLRISTESSHTLNMDNFSVGIKVYSGEDIGIVRYIGEIQGYEGQWLGVDWYNESRGKHNGTLNNIKYFSTKSNTSGSFIRPQKVSIGVTLVEALRQKYGETTNEEQERLIQEKLESVSKSINAPFLQLVGFEKLEKKQSDFKELKVVGLRGVYANDRGDLKELGLLCPNMHELDLSKNLFCYWNTIFSVCSEIKKLRRLNISENDLIIPENIPEGVLSQVKMIICGEMNCSWHDFVYLSQAWPNVEEVRLPFNGITHLNTTLDTSILLRNVKILFLQNNDMESWDEIIKLGNLESLEKLVLTECKIKNIWFPDCGIREKTNLFKKLQSLLIANNEIDNWQSIQELDKLQNLTELRCSRNPIDTSLTLSTIFQIVVARIGTLQNLNGTNLLAEDRRGAEYDYMKMFGNEFITSRTSSPEEFDAKHPRYAILVEKYGIPEEVRVKGESNISSNLIQLEITYDGKTISKKLPPNMLVSKFSNLVQRLFKLDFEPTIYYVSGKDASCERVMENCLKDLEFYSLQNGDTIYLRNTYSSNYI